jgi:hypothetical protein
VGLLVYFHIPYTVSDGSAVPNYSDTSKYHPHDVLILKHFLSRTSRYYKGKKLTTSISIALLNLKPKTRRHPAFLGLYRHLDPLMS